MRTRLPWSLSRLIEFFTEMKWDPFQAMKSRVYMIFCAFSTNISITQKRDKIIKINVHLQPSLQSFPCPYALDFWILATQYNTIVLPNLFIFITNWSEFNSNPSYHPVQEFQAQIVLYLWVIIKDNDVRVLMNLEIRNIYRSCNQNLENLIIK